MKKHYLVHVTADLPYPKTFQYRVQANTAGRAADFAIRLLKKEPAARKKREAGMHIRIPLIDPLCSVEVAEAEAAAEPQAQEVEPMQTFSVTPKEASRLASIFAH
jgi:hypothetical protein